MKTNQSKLMKVKNKNNGDVFYASKHHDKEIEGQQFVGVYRNPKGIGDMLWLNKSNITKDLNKS